MTSRLYGIGIVAIIVVAVGLAYTSMRHLSVTYDEVAHIPAGYVYWETHDFRLNPQHPPLIKLLAAIPLLFTHINLDLEDPSFHNINTNQWQFGKRFFMLNDTDHVLLLARLPMLGIFILLIYITY